MPEDRDTSWLQEQGEDRSIALGATPVRFVVSTVSDGDLRAGAPEGSPSAAARRSVADRTWYTVSQVHGARVAVVAKGCDPDTSPVGDGLATKLRGVALAVFGADCGLVALGSPEGVAGAVHAGWRGTCAGVIEAAAEEMRGLGASEIVAVLGPHIHAECYRFSPRDLDYCSELLGAEIRSVTREGEPAFDLTAALRIGLERAGVRLLGEVGGCTACSDRWYSARARGDRGRHSLVVFVSEAVAS